MDAREQLLQAAIKVYSTSGVRGATTKRIAQEAGVNEVTLFRHFGSKEACCRKRWPAAPRRCSSRACPPTPRDPATELLALARNHYKALWEHRELIRVAMGEFGEHPESTHVACEASARFDRELQVVPDATERPGAGLGRLGSRRRGRRCCWGRCFPTSWAATACRSATRFGQDAAVASTCRCSSAPSAWRRPRTCARARSRILGVRVLSAERRSSLVVVALSLGLSLTAGCAGRSAPKAPRARRSCPHADARRGAVDCREDQRARRDCRSRRRPRRRRHRSWPAASGCRSCSAARRTTAR